mmetsp:Transcript_13245/g.31455  ORF Transcript_13245/g.31455 Transcript_13245/m.31455 type:complete len:931 (-) Transcript_13245:1678-4470(-)
MLGRHPEGVDDDDAHHQRVVRLRDQDFVQIQAASKVLGVLRRFRFGGQTQARVESLFCRKPLALRLGVQGSARLAADAVDQHADHELRDESAAHEDEHDRKQDVLGRGVGARLLGHHILALPSRAAVIPELAAAAADQLRLARNVHERVEDRAQTVLAQQPQERHAGGPDVLEVVPRRRPHALHEDLLLQEDPERVGAGLCIGVHVGALDVWDPAEASADTILEAFGRQVVAGVEAAAEERDAHKAEEEHEDDEEVEDVEDGDEAVDQRRDQVLDRGEVLLHRPHDPHQPDRLEPAQTDPVREHVDHHDADEREVQDVPAALLRAREERRLPRRELDACVRRLCLGKSPEHEHLGENLAREEGQEGAIDQLADGRVEDRGLRRINLDENDREDNGRGHEVDKVLPLQQPVQAVADLVLARHDHSPELCPLVRVHAPDGRFVALCSVDDDVPQVLLRLLRLALLCSTIIHHLLPPFLELSQMVLVNVLLAESILLLGQRKRVGVAVDQVVAQDLLLLEQLDLEIDSLALWELEVIHDQRDEHAEHDEVGDVEVEQEVEHADDVLLRVPELEVLEVGCPEQELDHRLHRLEKVLEVVAPRCEGGRALEQLHSEERTEDNEDDCDRHRVANSRLALESLARQLLQAREMLGQLCDAKDADRLQREHLVDVVGAQTQDPPGDDGGELADGGDDDEREVEAIAVVEQVVPPAAVRDVLGDGLADEEDACEVADGVEVLVEPVVEALHRKRPRVRHHHQVREPREKRLPGPQRQLLARLERPLAPLRDLVLLLVRVAVARGSRLRGGVLVVEIVGGGLEVFERLRVVRLELLHHLLVVVLRLLDRQLHLRVAQEGAQRHDLRVLPHLLQPLALFVQRRLAAFDPLLVPVALGLARFLVQRRHDEGVDDPPNEKVVKGHAAQNEHAPAIPVLEVQAM